VDEPEVQPMWLTEYNRHVFAGVSGEAISLIGVFCRALVQKAFDEGVTMPPDGPAMAEDVGPGATIAYLDTLFGPDFWNLQFVGSARTDMLVGVDWSANVATEHELQKLLFGLFMRKIYERWGATKKRPMLLRKIAKFAERGFSVASCAEAITGCDIPSRTSRMKGGELPFFIQDYLARKLVTKADLGAVARKVLGQVPKLALSALVTTWR
jgi:hypothetical protein